SACLFQAEDGIRDATVTGVQTCALPICFDRWPCERRPLLDPIIGARIEQLTAYPAHHWHLSAPDTPLTPAGDSLLFVSDRAGGQIGRASCRERVKVGGGGGLIEKKDMKG